LVIALAKFTPEVARASKLGVRFSEFRPFWPRQSQRNWSEMMRMRFGRLDRSFADAELPAVTVLSPPATDERARKSRRVTRSELTIAPRVKGLRRCFPPTMAEKTATVAQQLLVSLHNRVP
jgi:hypothetical protein